eukprot:TRINITY_DN8065_c0_g1_i1.p1 TRINITY_DN8065_c0_g1~~TRINITY_DN8065_c0_g1_i1.p1  ORF type:complete len:496 (+),score=148.35 TRINITY_DN8065_c0_g1_i1:166-1488(+)
MVDRMQAENKALKTRMNEITSYTGVQEEGLAIISVNGKLEIRAGTVEKLIERLYNQDQLTFSEYVDSFLLTFRSFTTSQHVWKSLLDKFDSYSLHPQTVDLSKSERWSSIIKAEQDDMTKQKIRLRIIVVLKRWVEHHFSDFDAELISDFQSFIKAYPQDAEVVLLKKVLEVADKKNTGDVDRIGFSEQPPAPIVPSGVINFDTLEPVEIARQLTLVEWGLFKPIAPKELLSLSWQKSDAETRSPNLLKMIRRFNDVSNWVCYTVVKELDIKKRSALMKKFILLVDELYKLNNLNGVFEITSGMVGAPVSRLAKTWAMNGPKLQKMYERYIEFVSPAASFSAYRTHLSNTTSACIPYMGLFLSDLTFIEEGNPDFLENGFVNFVKFQMVASAIQKTQRNQRRPYNLTPVPAIVTFLSSHKALGEKELFELSLAAEPRERN